MEDRVTKFVQRGLDDLPGSAFVVRTQVLHVFQKHDSWLLCRDNFRNVEEQRALRFIFEAVFAAEAVFLGDTGYRKRLARKSPGQNVVVGNISRCDGRDIAERFFAEPGFVSLPSEPVDFR